MVDACLCRHSLFPGLSVNVVARENACWPCIYGVYGNKGPFWWVSTSSWPSGGSLWSRGLFPQNWSLVSQSGVVAVTPQGPQRKRPQDLTGTRGNAPNPTKVASSCATRFEIRDATRFLAAWPGATSTC